MSSQLHTFSVKVKLYFIFPPPRFLKWEKREQICQRCVFICSLIFYFSNMGLHLIRQFCLYSCCDHPCVAMHHLKYWIQVCGWSWYLNEFWAAFFFFFLGGLWIFQSSERIQPCLRQFEFVKLMTATGSIRQYCRRCRCITRALSFKLRCCAKIKCYWQY